MNDSLGAEAHFSKHDNDSSALSSEGTVSGCSRASAGELVAVLEPAARLAFRSVDAPLPAPATGEVLADDISGSFSASTKRAYRSDWACWSRWCTATGRAEMPAIAADVAAYLHALAADGKMFATLRRRLATLATAHQVAGETFDREAREIRFAMKALVRRLGSAPKNARAELMTSDVVAMLPKGDRLLAVRDRA